MNSLSRGPSCPLHPYVLVGKFSTVCALLCVSPFPLSLVPKDAESLGHLLKY